MGLVNEFKEFAVRGNVVDMAVGIVIGGAFGKIAMSLVTDVIMPPIGVVAKGVDFSTWAIPVQDAYTDINDKEVPAVVIQAGAFVNTIINFIVVAIAMFLVVKVMNRVKKKEEVQPTVKPPKQELLLEEIRDLLKSRGAGD